MLDKITTYLFQTGTSKRLQSDHRMNGPDDSWYLLQSSFPSLARWGILHNQYCIPLDVLFLIISIPIYFLNVKILDSLQLPKVKILLSLSSVLTITDSLSSGLANQLESRYQPIYPHCFDPLLRSLISSYGKKHYNVKSRQKTTNIP